MANPYRIVECAADTGEVIGVRWYGTRDECVARLSDPRKIARLRTPHFTLELQAPDGRIVSWRDRW